MQISFGAGGYGTPRFGFADEGWGGIVRDVVEEITILREQESPESYKLRHVIQ